MLKQRVTTALILAVGILLAIFLLPDWAWGMVVATIVVLALREWCALVKIGRMGFGVLALLCAAPLIYWGFEPSHIGGDSMLVLATAYGLAITFWLFSVPPMLHFRMEPVGWYWRYGAALTLMVPAGLALIELRHASPWLMLAALLVVSVADISAFFVGRRFGKRKLAPEISPGKTWEGAGGAVLGVLVFCLILWATVPAIQHVVGLVWLVVLALLYVLVSIIGDLFESLLKREAGVKDSGNLLPGHGGVLDRVDSMLAFFPFAGATLLMLQWLG